MAVGAVSIVKKSIWLTVNFLVIVFFTVGCQKEESNNAGELNLNFELVFDQQPVNSSEQWFTLNDSVELRFTKVSFYLSEISLKRSTENLLLTDIIHISFLQTILGDAINRYSLKIPFAQIPADNYSGLRMGLGVTSYINTLSPIDFSSGHPLSYTSEYWTPWDSYIFAKIEGEMIVGGERTETFVLHTGSDEAFREINWNNNIQITTDQAKEFNIPINLYKILQTYPITQQPRLHQLDQQEFVNQLSDNLANSLK